MRTDGYVGIMRYLLLPLLACCLLLGFTPTRAAPGAASVAAVTPHKHILVLYSYGHGGKGISTFDEALIKTLLASGTLEANDLYFEYLDIERNRIDPQYERQLTQLLQNKYAVHPIDAILTVQEPALRWLLHDGRSIAAQAPVVTVQAALPDLRAIGQRHIVSQLVRFDIPGTLKAALTLFPQTTHILLVAGNSDADKHAAANAQRTVMALYPALKIQTTSDQTLEATLQQAAHLPPHSIILYTQFNRDTAGHITLAYEVEKQVSAVANAPVFGLYDFNLQDGGIGGSVISVAQLGQRSAAMLLDIVSGTLSVNRQLTGVDVPPKLILDWGQINKWHADPTALAATTEFVNKTPTLYAQYRQYIIGIFVFITAQFCLITALLFSRHRQKSVELSLVASENRYRALIEQAPDAIVLYDFDLHKYVDCNAAALTLLKCSRAELLAVGPEKLLPPEQLRSRTVDDFVTETLHRVQDGSQFVAERMIRNFQGENISCEARFAHIPDKQRTLIRISLLDIGQRKQTETALRIAATAFESQLGMAITDANRIIQQVNHAFTEITGFQPEEVTGRRAEWPNIGRQDPQFHTDMWNTVAACGAWQGEILDYRKDNVVFPEWLTITAVKDEHGTVTHYVTTVSDISARKEAENEIAMLAFFDPLTHLPNRRLLMDRLTQVLASGQRHVRNAALLFIDLDNFKTLNDTLGHASGDQLLSLTGQRLSADVRASDTVARLGGDEFLVMLDDLDADPVAASAQAEQVGHKILASLRQPYTLGERTYNGTASIGITLLGEQHRSVDDIFKQADLAMYQAKADGRDTLCFFDPQMQAAVSAKAAMEADLRVAIERQQFELHYQAQVHDGKIVGAEALIRWNHPLRGMVFPGEFIALAENSGLILPLGQWVLRAACQQLAQWATSPATERLVISVNVSPVQFQQDSFVDAVHSVVTETGANPHRLKLELTESVMVANIDSVTRKMHAIKAWGIGFSLDDFGTGYSSLAYLKRLPLDQLKIDQGFVRDILYDANDAAIANMVIVLAQTLGLSVIAEGVETLPQRDLLASKGCHTYQGYLFSRPIPVADFEQLVRTLPGA